MPNRDMGQDELKRLAAERAVELVEDGMVLGLGTGSTAKFAIDRIGQRLRDGSLKDVVGVPTSQQTAAQAQSLAIPLTTLDDHPVVDLAIDGADEVDPNLDLIKGRGGALLREKMVETAARRLVIIADESKLVDALGARGPVPVEVVQFCWQYNALCIKDLGCRTVLRERSGAPFVTDNSNYILDCHFGGPLADPHGVAQAIRALPGVIEHGLFLDMADTVIVAGQDGVVVKQRQQQRRQIRPGQ
jgi:ribose 5-phosphate isomerase A